MKHEQVFLIGMMGIGKTTVGQLLAQKMNRLFIDSDIYIEESTGMSVSQIFSSLGEAYFRNLENIFLDSLPHYQHKLVIACGGGLPTLPNALERMKKNGTLIFLDGDPRVLFSRIQQNGERPLLSNEEAFVTLYKERLIFYNQADIRIDISHTPEETATALYLRLQELWS